MESLLRTMREFMPEIRVNPGDLAEAQELFGSHAFTVIDDPYVPPRRATFHGLGRIGMIDLDKKVVMTAPCPEWML